MNLKSNISILVIFLDYNCQFFFKMCQSFLKKNILHNFVTSKNTNKIRESIEKLFVDEP